MVNSPDRQRIREWFILGCGLIGILQLLRAAEYVMTAFDISIGYYRPAAGSTFGGAMLHTFGHFFLALWLMGGAPKIAAFFYPDKPPDTKQSDEHASGSDTPAI